MTIPEIPLIDVFGRGGSLKSSWYGDCLPVARLPDARRPLPAGPARPRRLRDRGDRHRRRRGGVRRRCTGATSCARWWSCERPGRPRRRLRHLLPRRGDPRGRQQRLGDRRRRAVPRHRRPARRRRDPRGSSPAARSRRSCAPTPTTTTCAWRRRCGVATGAPILLHPDDRPLWELTHGGDEEGAELWDVDLSDGMTLTIGGAAVTVIHTPGHAPGAVCLYVHDLGCVFTGDTLFEGGPGATGTVLQRRRRHQGLDPAPALRPARRDGRAHRPRPDTTIGAERENV